ncbi:hypothetical protein K1T71_008536 [Dendrolimus kikuchii]|uniref:Uncharacterized protein n=1 Tax=Dendrolimus kikuchii TaxID=765133 RepID=A0ACC1CVS7_9NEOP|nr:hypothetical protein K1T71_008536 [Dendrolimus kikuchii]
MAATVVSGCDYVESRKIDSEDKLKESNDKETKVLNGKTSDNKNGYLKSSLRNGNGLPHKDENGGGIPEIDWSQYDTYPGSFEKSTLLTAALTHIGLVILMFLGFVNRLLFKPKVATEKNREGYAPLYDPFEQFFSRYVYRRLKHCFNKPVCSAPGAELTIKERESLDRNWTFRFTGVEQRCINMGSYNYLGFAEGAGGATEAAVAGAARAHGLALCSPRAELGTTPLHLELEEELARFLGVEAAVVFGMGFATNALSLPGLLGPATLAISDENNHASLILGLRLSRATVRVFRHNDVRHAERLARAALAEGRWRNIVLVVEGVYSMEGSIAPLRALVALKRRLGLQLYLDEAHSVGALGPRGRGVADHAGVDPRDVDVLMGTFTKSFAAAGGYIAGSAALVRRVRAHGHGHAYAHAMAPPVAAQVLAATRAIASPQGQRRVARLRENARHFRRRLAAMGVVVFGHRDSPVVPMLVYTFSKMAATVERLAARRIATVGVGFPATPLNKARIRFCLSASHTREQLDECLAAVEAVADELGLRYARGPSTPQPST